MRGKRVSAIADMAFYKVEHIEYAYIPANIKYIGHQAFANCVNLKQVIWEGDIHTTVELGHLVFNNCKNLTVVTIKSMLNPGTKDFNNCSNLLGFDCDYVESIPSDFFNGCTSLTHLNFTECGRFNKGSISGSSVSMIEFSTKAPILCDGTVEQWIKDGIKISCSADNPLAELSYQGVFVYAY